MCKEITSRLSNSYIIRYEIGIELADTQSALQTTDTYLAGALELKAESGVISVTSPVSHFASLGQFHLLKVFLNNVVIEEDGV